MGIVPPKANDHAFDIHMVFEGSFGVLGQAGADHKRGAQSCSGGWEDDLVPYGVMRCEVRHIWRVIYAILFVTLLGREGSGQGEPEFPSPRGYVNDFAGILDAESQARMDALIRQVRERMGVEIAVVTVPSLGEMPIEEYSIELARRWGIGQEGEDTGVLFLVAPNERRWRIEVGYGLEGELPDGLVGEIGRRMVPYFREQRYGEGMFLGLQTLVATLAQKRGIRIEDADASLAYSPQGRRRAGMGLVVLLLVLFFLMFVIAATTGMSRRGRGRSMRPRPTRDSDWLWYPIIFSGGGSGGFGGHIGGSSHGWGGFRGFGGFGGGSFGGGGASGSW